MAESHFDEWIAERFQLLWPELFEPGVVEPSVELLADLAGTGSALEFGIGTGRIAVPLSHRGVRVQGIELSAAMVAQLRAQHDTSNIDVTIGDFATTKVDGSFSLVYLLRNTITNLITQDEQVEAFRNAAAHLESGGRFVIENYVPELRRLPAGETIHVFTATPTHLGFENYDTANQTANSGPLHDCGDGSLWRRGNDEGRRIGTGQSQPLPKICRIDIDAAFLDLQNADLGFSDPTPENFEVERQPLPHLKRGRARCVTQLITCQVRDLGVQQPGTELIAQVRNCTRSDNGAGGFVDVAA
jgi:hypothetical protein